jgi:hypothetical protein
VGGANPAVSERDDMLAQDPTDDVRFSASIKFTPSVSRYSIQMKWDVRAVNGRKTRANSTVEYDHTGRYERTDST